MQSETGPDNLVYAVPMKGVKMTDDKLSGNVWYMDILTSRYIPNFNELAEFSIVSQNILAWNKLLRILNLIA